jgi:hypothetical protein
MTSVGAIISAHRDEKYYEAVVRELESGSPRPGLWAKAFAESSGDEVATRALYIKLRAEQLSHEDAARTAADHAARSKAFLERLGIKWEPILILAVLLGLGWLLFF